MRERPVSYHQQRLQDLHTQLRGAAPTDIQRTRTVLLALLQHMIDLEEQAYELLVKPREQKKEEEEEEQKHGRET